MRSFVLIMIALSCGLVAAIGVFQYLDRVRASERVEKKTVLVAAKEININEALNRDNVRSAEWPRAQVPQGALADLKQLEGQYARVRLYPGEPVLQAKVMGIDDTAGSLKVPLGFRVVSVKVTDESSVSNLVEPGDRVDVVAVLKETNQTPIAIAKTILKAVRVFAVNAEMARTVEEEKALGQTRTVSLLLKPDQVEKLMMAADLGNIRLSLRGPEDPNVSETTGCTVEKIMGQGDVADNGLVNGLLSVAGFISHRAQGQGNAEADDPAPVWTMVIDSPQGAQRYRWTDATGSPAPADGDEEPSEKPEKPAPKNEVAGARDAAVSPAAG